MPPTRSQVLGGRLRGLCVTALRPEQVDVWFAPGIAMSGRIVRTVIARQGPDRRKHAHMASIEEPAVIAGLLTQLGLPARRVVAAAGGSPKYDPTVAFGVYRPTAPRNSGIRHS